MASALRTFLPRSTLGFAASIVSILTWFACISSSYGAVLLKRAQPTMSTYLVNKVKGQAISSSTDTWTSGTLTKALLEICYSSLTVYNPNIVTLLNASSFSSSSLPTSSNNIIAQWAAKRSSSSTQFATVSGGAAADPAALGWAWIVASKTVSSSSTRSNYETIIQQELAYLQTVPTTSDGAMSHRPSSEPVQLWSDFIYMVPPFLAGRGLETNNSTLILQAYSLIRAYRHHMQDTSTGLWKHVQLGNWQDDGLWATGNAWAAAGITRVLATMITSGNRARYSSQISDLVQWASEIVNGSFARLDSNGMVPNYFGVTGTFSDSASSALLASVPFRLSQLGYGRTSQLTSAVALRDKVIAKISTSSGWLQGCVDPLSWTEQSNQSPEAQSFVLLLEAAYRDYLTSTAREWRQYCVRWQQSLQCIWMRAVADGSCNQQEIRGGQQYDERANLFSRGCPMFDL